MIARLQQSMKERDKGFTLVELLVVIVIIGILAGIAIPMFLSQRRKGVDAGVKADIKNLSTALETYYVDERSYEGATAGTAASGQEIADATGDAIEITEGNTIELVTNAEGNAYCIRGFNDDGNKDAATNAFLYASDGGGLHDTEDPKGTCASATTFPVTVTSVQPTP